MRRRIVTVFGVAAAVVVALGAPASAGENMHVEVNKVVVGNAPPGTTFTIHYACTDGGPSGDLSFDATGKPVPANSNFFNDGFLGSTCTVTETATGGATDVAYACKDDSVNASCGSSGNEVTFDSPTNLSNTVTFTITNSFVAPAPAPDAAPSAPSTPSASEPAAAVAGAPRLTG
ncbi:MAG: DUF5979 domain-containing protein [Actinomycetota bacterium]|nr:DUF5979 domain-containing protein [Actinomycetota bacterium]